MKTLNTKKQKQFSLSNENSKNNYYVQIYTTHKKHSQPFDPKYTHTL